MVVELQKALLLHFQGRQYSRMGEYPQKSESGNLKQSPKDYQILRFGFPVRLCRLREQILFQLGFRR